MVETPKEGRKERDVAHKHTTVTEDDTTQTFVEAVVEEVGVIDLLQAVEVYCRETYKTGGGEHWGVLTDNIHSAVREWLGDYGEGPK